MGTTAASSNGINALFAVWALAEILPLAAPAVQQRAAGALMGLGRILEQGAAQDAARLLSARDTAADASGDAAGPANGSGSRRGSQRRGLLLAAALLGLLAHRYFQTRKWQ